MANPGQVATADLVAVLTEEGFKELRIDLRLRLTVSVRTRPSATASLDSAPVLAQGVPEGGKGPGRYPCRPGPPPALGVQGSMKVSSVTGGPAWPYSSSPQPTTLPSAVSAKLWALAPTMKATPSTLAGTENWPSS